MRQDRINALESEVVAYETDLERAEDELLELHTTLDGYKIKIEGLQAKIDRPEPLFDFGRKGEKWSYKVFGFAAELLCLRLTAEQCARVTETFLRTFYPHHRIRVPLNKTFEKWRSMLYPIVKFVNVQVISSCFCSPFLFSIYHICLALSLRLSCLCL